MQFVIKIFFIFVFSQSIMAKSTDQEVLIITSNFNKKTYSLILTVNENYHVIGVKTRNNSTGKVKTYPASYLSKEIVLAKVLGIKLITLKCLNFNRADGCKILIKYPYNLPLADFDTFKSYMSLNGKKWSFFKRGKKFKKLILNANKALGILIGFKKIEYK